MEDPKYSILVVLDEPDSSASGGTSAAPAAISIMEQIIGSSNTATSSEGVANTITVPDLVGQSLDTAKAILEEKGILYTVKQQDSGTTVLSQSIAAKSAYNAGDQLELVVGTSATDHDGKVIVPDLSGLSVQSCNELLKGLSLNLKVQGSGFAKEQTPAAGTSVDKNTDVTVKFSE